MKPVIVVIIVLTVILSAVAGSFVMSRMMNITDHADCPAAIPGITCLNGVNPFQFAVSHINALLSMSLGIVGSLIIGLFSTLVLLAWLTVPLLAKFRLTISHYLRIFTERSILSLLKQRFWISLLEKRDPSFALAVSR